MKKWQKENPDRLRQYNKKRQNKNHKISLWEWIACKEYFNYTCAYCGVHEVEHYNKHKQQFHKEHFEHDGLDDLSNCLPSCKDCNSSKWEFDFTDWYIPDNPVYSQERYDKIIKWLYSDYKIYMEE